MQTGKLRYVIGTIEITAFLILLAIITVLVRSYEIFPGELATTVASSIFVKLGGKNLFLYVFILAMSIYSILFVIGRFPRLPYYPVKITPQNVDIEMKLARLMYSIMKLLAMALMLVIMVALYVLASKRVIYVNIQLPIFLLVACMIINAVVYVALAFKYK